MNNRVRYTIFSLLPIIGAFILQGLAAMAVMVWDGVHGTDITNATENAFYKTDLSIRAMYLYAIAGVLVFTLYYMCGCNQTRYPKMKPLFTKRTIAAIPLAGIGLQGLISGILNMLMIWKPGILDGYNEMLQNSGIGGTGWMSVVCTVILAPILEELVFRGISIHFLRKATFNFYVVNLLQALWFGIFHLNLVQGIYAFALGLVFGYIYYKYGSVLVSILIHMVLNLSGVLLSKYGGVLMESTPMLYTMSIVSLLMVFGGILFISSDCPHVDTVGYIYDVSKKASKQSA